MQASAATRPAVSLWGGAKKAAPALAKQGTVDYPFSLLKRHGQVDHLVLELTLTDANGYMIADGTKKWEGRPVAGSGSSLSTRANIVFRVGSHNDPWYIYARVTNKVEYESLRAMLEDKQDQLLPHDPSLSLDDAISYYELLGSEYKMGGFVAIEIDVVCCWYGRERGTITGQKRKRSARAT